MIWSFKSLSLNFSSEHFWLLRCFSLYPTRSPFYDNFYLRLISLIIKFSFNFWYTSFFLIYFVTNKKLLFLLFHFLKIVPHPFTRFINIFKCFTEWFTWRVFFQPFIMLQKYYWHTDSNCLSEMCHKQSEHFQLFVFCLNKQGISIYRTNETCNYNIFIFISLPF